MENGRGLKFVARDWGSVRHFGHERVKISPIAAFGTFRKIIEFLLRLDDAGERFAGDLLQRFVFAMGCGIQHSAYRVGDFDGYDAHMTSPIILKNSRGSTAWCAREWVGG